MYNESIIIYLDIKNRCYHSQKSFGLPLTDDLIMDSPGRYFEFFFKEISLVLKITAKKPGYGTAVIRMFFLRRKKKQKKHQNH